MGPLVRSRPEVLYREHGPALLRYLVRMSGDADTAADVLQDTFHRLLDRPPRDARNVRGWLFRVATNRLSDVRRARGRRDSALHMAGPGHAHADPPPLPDRATEAEEARLRAHGILAALPERDRAILLMREEGFTHREIAEAVGTTTGSVGTMIARALDRAADVAEVGKVAATGPPHTSAAPTSQEINS